MTELAASHLVVRSNATSPCDVQKEHFTFKETVFTGQSAEKGYSVEKRFTIQPKDKFMFANRYMERHRTVGYFEVKVLLGGFYD